jgi:hypothetical protein
MNDLIKLIQDLNIPPEKFQELATAMQQNPFAAMGMIQQLGISTDVLQKIMATVMTNPAALLDAAKQFGVGDETLAQVQSHLGKLGDFPKE